MSKAQSSFAEKEMEAYGKERTFTLTVFLNFYKVFLIKNAKVAVYENAYFQLLLMGKLTFS